MPTTITMQGQSGRAAITARESVAEIVEMLNAALITGQPQFVLVNNTADQVVAIRSDQVQGFFDEHGELDITIGRAGVGAAMMQMNRRASVADETP